MPIRIVECAIDRRIRDQLSFHHQANSPAMTMPRPSNHSQYSSKKPGAAISWTGWAMVAGRLVGGGTTAGAAFSTIAAGAATGAGGAASGGMTAALAAFFFALRTTGLGAGSATNTGCSATTAGAGSASATGATSGAAGCSATASTGAGAATGASFGLLAQPAKARAERSRTNGMTTFRVLDMKFPRNTIRDMSSRAESSHRYSRPAND